MGVFFLYFVLICFSSLQGRGSGGVIVSGGADQCARVWSVGTRSVLAVLSCDDPVTCVASTGPGAGRPGNKTVAAGTDAGDVCVWVGADFEGLDGEPPSFVVSHAGMASVLSLVFPVPAVLVSSAEDASLIAWSRPSDGPEFEKASEQKLPFALTSMLYIEPSLLCLTDRGEVCTLHVHGHT